MAPIAGVLDQPGPDCLEEADLVADSQCLVGGDGQGESLGEQADLVDEPAGQAVGLVGLAVLVVLLVDVVHRGADDADPGGGVVAEDGRVVEAVEHGRDDLVLLQHLGDGLGLVDADLATVAAGVVRECLLELVGQAEVIDHQAAGLVAEDAVDPGDRLHQSVAAHRLVGVHRVQAGGVEAGQPHVADDHQPERVVGVLEPLGQGLAAGLVADVLLPFELVRRRAGHDDLDRPPAVVFLVPLRAELDDLVVQVDADPPAHADDHALAVDRGESLLEVVDQVLGHELDSLLGPDQRLQACPLALELLLLVQLLALGDLLEVLVELRPLGLVKFDLGQPAFVVDPDGRPVLDGPLDVVHVDVVAEDGLGVLVGQLDRACP